MEITSSPTIEAVGVRIVEALVEFGADPDMMQSETTLEQLEIDSLDLFELAQILHQEFGLEINPEDFQDALTLGDAQRILLGYIK